VLDPPKDASAAHAIQKLFCLDSLEMSLVRAVFLHVLQGGFLSLLGREVNLVATNRAVDLSKLCDVLIHIPYLGA